MRTPEPWHRAWMGMARLIADRSKDPSFQAGAVLVAADGRRVLGLAYNGPPPAIPDDFDWSNRELKHATVIHAEDNCLWFAGTAHGMDALKGGTLFVNGKPCSACAKTIARSGLTKVVYDDTSVKQPRMVDDAEWAKTNDVLRRAGVELTPYSTLED